MRARIAAPFLWLYERLARLGLFERPGPRRVFESAYLAYKRIEAGPVAPLRSFATPGSTVIDVGANIGFFTLRFARWIEPGGRVIAIEPERRNVSSLERRVASAGLDSTVECVAAAAADRAGELRLELNPLHPGDHRISADGEPVKAITIDQLTSGSRGFVSLIKIDVQGAEAMVIAGARETLAESRPALFIEIDGGALEGFGSSARELIESVVELGYSPHLLSRRGIGPSQSVDALLGASAAAGYSDVLFVPTPG